VEILFYCDIQYDTDQSAVHMISW